MLVPKGGSRAASTARSRTATAGTVLVLAIALVTVTSPMLLPSALATHNSRGVSVHVAQADEVQPDGTLDPDVPSDGPYNLSFHDQLPVPRPAPEDQSGLRYTGDSCTTWAAYQAGSFSDTYGQLLLDGRACYVGFLDAQLEYSFIQGPLSPQFSSDKLYPYNPPPSDEHCTGEEDTGQRSVSGPVVGERTVPLVLGDDSAVDASIARVLRSDDPQCSGGGHEVFRNDEVAIDTDLIESGTGDPAASLTSVPTASGTLTLPLQATEYVFLFGQPHPNNPNPSPFEAGEGPFGSDPAQGGHPLADISGACGERTRDCRLLTGQDLDSYDVDHAPDTSGKARLCSYAPEGNLLVDQRTHDGRCGVRGRPVNAFFPNATEGGLGVSPTPTWATTLPGWHSTGRVLLHGGHNGATAAIQSYTTESGEVPPGTTLVYAVNPAVPTPGHPLDCVRPGILAEGDDTVLGIDDPGVYGTYQADAIDVDLYVHPSRPAQRDVRDATHDEIQPTVAAAQALAEDVGGPSQAADKLGLPQAAVDGIDRADPVEGQPEEPRAQPGPDNPRPFQRTLGPGLVCDGPGTLRALDEQLEIPGGLHVDAVIHGLPGGEDLWESYGLVDQGVPDPAPKDPTQTDDGLPARESETGKGGWAPRTYSFQAHTEARLDTNLDGGFEGNCLTATSAEVRDEPQDTCVWTGIWDAYNPRCQNRAGEPCSQILADRGYDVHGQGAGVGLYWVLKVTGPTLVTPWSNLFFHESCCIGISYAENTQLLGAGTPSAQNCVVGVSIGFADKLRERHGEDLLDAFCDGGDGDRLLIENAMFRQFGPDSPPANAKVQWTPLMPRPDALNRTAGTGFGSGDSLCIHGIWNVQDGTTASDTVGNIELGPGRHVFTDCDRLDAGHPPS